MRPILLVIILFSVPLFPAAQAEDVVQIGVPTAGSVAHYQMSYENGDRVLSTWNVTDTWSAVKNVRDGHGLDRPAYTVMRDDGCDWDYPCAPLTYQVDPATRLIFEQSGRGGLILSLGQTRTGPLMSERYFDFTYDMHIFATSPMLEWLGHGLQIAEGNTYSFPVPPSWRYPDGGAATLAGVGWETIDDRDLFRVEAHAVLHGFGNWSTTLWYDGILAVPVRTFEDFSFQQCSADGCALHERYVIGTLADHAPGTEPLVAPAVEERSRREDVVRVALTRSGPADLELASFPRAQAFAEVSAHPTAAPWFALHPDAYLVFGTGHEDTRSGYQVSWRLTWAEGADLLHAELVRPFAAGQTVPVTTETTVTNGTTTSAYPTYAALPSGPIACMEQARRDLRDRLGAVDAPRADTDVWWRVDARHPHEPICSVGAFAPRAAPAIEDHPPGGVAVTERNHVLIATLGADSGALRFTAEGHPGSVDRFWLPGRPLP